MITREELFKLAEGKDRETLKNELLKLIPGWLETAPRWFLNMTHEEIAEMLLQEVEAHEQRRAKEQG